MEASTIGILLRALPGSLTLGALTIGGLLFAAPLRASAQGGPLSPPVELRVPKPPTAGSGDGESFLAYELHVTNFSSVPLTLRRVEVLSAGADARVLLTLEDSLLSRALARPGVTPVPPLEARSRLAGGLRAIVYLWVTVDAGKPPARLRHRLTLVRGVGDSASTQMVEGESVPVFSEVAVIGPPLRGGGWLTGNGPHPLTGHRRALIPVNGTPTIAQRFAIDYVKLNEGGTSFVGDRLNNASYLAENAEAIAVADAVVMSTKDDIVENVPGITSRAVPITLETIGGNFVILDIGKGRYAFYAHLRPGSLRVRPGDRVRRGQVLGLVGNSGNSTEPHLHFHISDGPSALGSEGLPYAIDSFQLEGRCGRLLAECTRNTPAEARRREMPMANMIVLFPN